MVGPESSFAVDSISAPIISNYDPGSQLSLCITDATNGKRETTGYDYNPNNTTVLVDSNMNLPGLGVRNVTVGTSNYTEMFQSFPGYTRNFDARYTNDTVVWRFLPVTANSIKNTDIQLSLKSYATFDDHLTTRWRDAYSGATLNNYRDDVESVFNVAATYIDRSFGYENNIPQYCINFEHHVPESGFLWRNTDLASIMLWTGYLNNNSNFINHARTVINDQVNANRIVTSDAGWDRAVCEGLEALLKAYNIDKSHGVDNANWKNYLLNNAGNYKTSVFAVPLMIGMYNLTNDSSYKTAALNIGNSQWSGGWNTWRFRNGLQDYSGMNPTFDREAGYKALEAFTSLYEATNDSTWLDRAKIAATYCETYQIIQNLQEEPWGRDAYNNRPVPKH